MEKRFYSEYANIWEAALEDTAYIRMAELNLETNDAKLFLKADVIGSDNINEEYYIGFFAVRGFDCKAVAECEKDIARASVIVGNSDTISLVADKISKGTTVIILERLPGICDTDTVSRLNSSGVAWCVVDATFNFLPTPYEGGVAFFAPTADFKSMLMDFGIAFNDEELDFDKAVEAPLYDYFVVWAKRYATHEEYAKIKDKRFFNVLREINKHLNNKILDINDYVFKTNASQTLDNQLETITALRQSVMEMRATLNETWVPDTAKMCDDFIVLSGSKRLPYCDVTAIEINMGIIASADNERQEIPCELEYVDDTHLIMWNISIPISAITDMIERTGSRVNIYAEISNGHECYQPKVAVTYKMMTRIVETVSLGEAKDRYLVPAVDDNLMLSFDLERADTFFESPISAHMIALSHNDENIRISGRIDSFIPFPEEIKVSAYIALAHFNKSKRIDLKLTRCILRQNKIDWDIEIDLACVQDDLRTKLVKCPCWELFFKIRVGNRECNLPISVNSRAPEAEAFSGMDIEIDDSYVLFRQNDSHALCIEFVDTNNLLETCWVQNIYWEADRFVAGGWLVMRPACIDDIDVDIAFSEVEGDASAIIRRIDLTRVDDVGGECWQNASVKENQLNRLYTWTIDARLSELAATMTKQIANNSCEYVLSMLVTRHGDTIIDKHISARRTPGLFAKYKRVPQFIPRRKLQARETGDDRSLSLHISAK